MGRGGGGQKVMIGIIISENDDKAGRPLTGISPTFFAVKVETATVIGERLFLAAIVDLNKRAFSN